MLIVYVLYIQICILKCSVKLQKKFEFKHRFNEHLCSRKNVCNCKKKMLMERFGIQVYLIFFKWKKKHFRTNNSATLR